MSENQSRDAFSVNKQRGYVTTTICNELALSKFASK